MLRNSIQTGRWIVIAVAIGLFCSAEALAVKPVKPVEPAAYTIVPFMPDGSQSTSSNVWDINDQGRAVGCLEFADGASQAVHFDIALREYTTLADGAHAKGINNWNQIVGSNGITALFWESPSDNEPTELPSLQNDLAADVLGINDAGIAVGYLWSEEEGALISVVWRITVADGDVDIDDPVLLPPLKAGGFTQVSDINEVVNGVAQVVGESGVVGESASEAVIWTVVVDEDGTLAEPSVQAVGVTGLTWSTGYGINNLADVCGRVDGLPYVVDFTDPEPQVLPLPRKVSSGSARDINDHGDIVGYATEWTKFYPGRNYAQLWRGGERIDLATQIPDDSGWVRLSSAWHINNHGVIGGGGVFDVPTRGFIMIPNEN